MRLRLLTRATRTGRFCANLGGRSANTSEVLREDLIHGGADVRHVQELLGYASLSSTAIYTRVATADLRGVIRKSHPRERTWRGRGKA